MGQTYVATLSDPGVIFDKVYFAAYGIAGGIQLLMLGWKLPFHWQIRGTDLSLEC
jgi:hypothetical protein